MHLTLFREYLDIEFGAIKNSLPFPYDVERIIDDFILMGFFVGNDFLPSLPSMYIPNGSLSVMFLLYKHLLPSLGASRARPRAQGPAPASPDSTRVSVEGTPPPPSRAGARHVPPRRIGSSQGAT